MRPRALAAWPELADLAEILVRQWPGGRRGFHRIEWPQIGVILDLAIQEAEAALDAWSGSADAWFLDGFSPAKNPQMWRPEVLSLIAARSSAGARVATFSVAGAVRRGLAGVGFEVQKAPGFGGKKQRLEGRLASPDASVPDPDNTPRVAIIGAGVAGASLARAFGRLGAAPRGHRGGSHRGGRFRQSGRPRDPTPGRRPRRRRRPLRRSLRPRRCALSAGDPPTR